MMESRSLTPADRILSEISKAINVLTAPARSSRPYPGGPGAGVALSEAEMASAASLMRVNHAGEVAAQALYHGQAFWARKPGISAALNTAALEEMDHLAWCERRIRELGGRTSLLNPVWYAGSFLIGALAARAGDATSLGFVTETEAQVESHLKGHLRRLPAADAPSRRILEAMAADEVAHGAMAARIGGKPLPGFIRTAMKWTARLMTVGSSWL